MGGKALFGHVVHAFATDLYFDPLAVVAHQGDVKRLITVGFRVAYPVAQSVGVGLVYLGNSYIDVETVIQFFFQILGREDDADGQDVVDFFEGNMLGLHLVPDGVNGLDTCQNMVLHAHFVQLGTDRSREVLENLVAFGGCGFQLLLDDFIFLRMFIFEAEVFQFGLDLVEAQAVGQWGINVHGFTGNFVLLAGKHGAEGAHVVKSVGNLDEDDANVIAHCKQQLFEVFSLCGSLVAKDTT